MILKIKNRKILIFRVKNTAIIFALIFQKRLKITALFFAFAFWDFLSALQKKIDLNATHQHCLQSNDYFYDDQISNIRAMENSLTEAESLQRNRKKTFSVNEPQDLMSGSFTR